MERKKLDKYTLYFEIKTFQIKPIFLIKKKRFTAVEEQWLLDIFFYFIIYFTYIEEYLKKVAEREL